MMQIDDLCLYLGISRAEFCRRYNIPIRTAENWAYGKSEAPAWALQLLNRVVQEDWWRYACFNGLSLMNLTGQESGLIVYENDVILVNWRECGEKELPMIDPLGASFIPFPAEAAFESCCKERVWNIVDEIPDGLRITYDKYQEKALSELTTNKTPGWKHTLADGTIILAPAGWA